MAKKTTNKFTWKSRWNRNEGRYTPDPGECKGMKCGLCKTTMNVTRGQIGARSWAGAMAGSKSEHDVFECPHLDEKWHRQLRGLRSLAEKTPSAVFANMIEEEMDYILKTRKQTKTWFDF